MKSLGSKQALEITAGLFLGRMLVCGLTVGDALAAAFIVAGILGLEVVGYLFPKRPDLFKEVEALTANIEYLRQRISEQESDITALKFGVAKR